MTWWQGSDVKWKVVCFSEHSQLCAWSSPLRLWRRLSRFGAPHHRLSWRELVLGGLLPWPACGHRLARVGQFRDNLEDYIPLGHAGCQKSGLHKQSPPERPLPIVWLAPILEDRCRWFLSQNAACEQKFHTARGEMIARMDRLLLFCTMLRE